MPEIISDKFSGFTGTVFQNEDDYYKEDDADHLFEEEEKKNKPEKHRHLTEMLALIAVIAMAGAILILLFVQNYIQKSEENIADGEVLNERLVEIRNQLSSLDSTVQQEGGADILAAEGIYEELSSTIDTLEGNLTAYKEQGNIHNETIVSNMNNVMDSLTKMRQDLEEARGALGEENAALGSRLNQMTADDRSSEQNISRDLDNTRTELRRLIESTADAQDADYIDMINELEATENSLQSILQTRFDENGLLIDSLNTKIANQLTENSDRITNSLNENALAAAQSANALGEKIDTSLNGMNERITDSVGTMGTQLSEKMGNVNDRLLDTREDIDDIKSGVNDLDKKTESIEELVKGLRDNTGSLSDKAETMNGNLTKLDTVLAQYEGLQIILTEISSAITSMRTELNDLKNRVSTISCNSPAQTQDDHSVSESDHSENAAASDKTEAEDKTETEEGSETQEEENDPEETAGESE